MLQDGLAVPCRLRYAGPVKEFDKLSGLLDLLCGRDAKLQGDIASQDSAVEIPSKFHQTDQQMHVTVKNHRLLYILHVQFHQRRSDQGRFTSI